MTLARRVLRAALLVALSGVGVVAWLNRDDAQSPPPPPVASATPDQLARGAYLARIANCQGCHTVPGHAAYAGGRAIETPFGTVWSPNITPDAATGLGHWTSQDFWHALHDGKSRSGRLLSPAFPYTNFTRITRADADALFAFLRTVTPVTEPARASGLRFPYGTPWALAVWRALFFRPGVFEPDPQHTATWNRGAYLAEGAGHCAACHALRNALGGITNRELLEGGPLPAQPWYAPALAGLVRDDGAGTTRTEVARLLTTGTNARGTAIGPMAEVVSWSTRHLTPDDAAALADYLASRPATPATASTRPAADPALLNAGRALYADRCRTCHGASGEGHPGKYPPLAGNLTVALPSPVNLVNAIRSGGFAPVTPGNPRPYGMPPYGQFLSQREIATVASYVRVTWGRDASGVSELDVQRAR